MGSRPADLFDCVLPIALNDAHLMAKRHWPGALTMVLPASGPLVDALNTGENTLGMRVPACKMARDLLFSSGPLATTSANLSGRVPAQNNKEASHNFPEIPLLAPIPWPLVSGKASTVIKWESIDKWSLLREGDVIPENIEKI